MVGTAYAERIAAADPIRSATMLQYVASAFAGTCGAASASARLADRSTPIR